jgi:hypothetical protein
MYIGLNVWKDIQPEYCRRSATHRWAGCEVRLVRSLRHFDDRQLRALKEAVRNVFWTKKDIRRAFEHAGTPNSLVSLIDWENNKTWDSADQALESLNASSNGESIIRKIAKETLQYPDGEHLRWAGQERVDAAVKSLNFLREVLGEKKEELRKAEASAQAREAAAEEANRNKLRNTKLNEIFA